MSGFTKYLNNLSWAFFGLKWQSILISHIPHPSPPKRLFLEVGTFCNFMDIWSQYHNIFAINNTFPSISFLSNQNQFQATLYHVPAICTYGQQLACILRIFYWVTSSRRGYIVLRVGRAAQKPLLIKPPVKKIDICGEPPATEHQKWCFTGCLSPREKTATEYHWLHLR